MSFLSRLFNPRLFGRRQPAPRPRPIVIQPEDRLIEDIVFCGARKPTLKDVTDENPSKSSPEALAMWNAIHEPARIVVRGVLHACGVEKAGDINTVGCTGVIKSGLTIEAASALILNLAGSGFGLPCFVPTSRYCNVHKTIGGLQDGQKQHHEEKVEAVSRPLTPAEQGKVKLTEAARRIRGGSLADRQEDAQDMLGGHVLPAGFDKEEGEPT